MKTAMLLKKLGLCFSSVVRHDLEWHLYGSADDVPCNLHGHLQYMAAQTMCHVLGRYCTWGRRSIHSCCSWRWWLMLRWVMQFRMRLLSETVFFFSRFGGGRKHKKYSSTLASPLPLAFPTTTIHCNNHSPPLNRRHYDCPLNSHPKNNGLSATPMSDSNVCDWWLTRWYVQSEVLGFQLNCVNSS